MTPAAYQSALTALSLTPDQAATWLGIGRSTAYRYLKTGCEGPVARCLEMAVAVYRLEQYDVQMPDVYGLESYVRHSDLTAAVGFPGWSEL